MKKTFNLVKKVSAFMLAGLLLFTGCAGTTGNNNGTNGNTNNNGGTEENTTVSNANVGDFEIGTTSVEMAKNMAIG